MKRNSPAYIIGFMAAISIVFGSAVSAVHFATLGTMKKNDRMHVNVVICDAFGLAARGRTADGYAAAVAASIDTAVIESDGHTFMVYRQKGPGGAVGFVFRGMGFWDAISGIAVLSPDFSKIMRVRILDQKETPGLGARIEEPRFTAQFESMPVEWDRPAGERIQLGKSANPADRNRIDAITGATQTSTAFVNLLNTELDRFKNAFTRTGAR